MMWVMFNFLLVMCVIFSAIFVYAVFWNKGGWIGKIGSGGIDGTIGLSFQQVVKHLFPSTEK
jgi:hypothetical protein